MDIDMTGQRRASAGGELGPNGEWYRGGEFIATSENTRKGAGHVERRELTPEECARIEADRVRGAAIDAWLGARRVALAPIIATLTAQPVGLGVDAAVWAQRVVDHAAGFLPSLGRTIWAGGTLSERQAAYVAKAIIGRRTKRTAAEWDALIASLTEEWSE